jgi:2-hydroxychromene-2-carboxylate isomerase
MTELEDIKFYYDYKSPFAYLALEPALALETSHRVKLRPIPAEIDIPTVFGGVEDRTERSWNKVRYLYLDARRFANERGLTLLGPQKVFDSRLSLLGGLYAETQGLFAPYSKRVFEGFFQRRLDLENVEALERAMEEVGCDPAGFRDYAEGAGPEALARATEERNADRVFGVPTLLVRGEPFWGYDRLNWVVRKLDQLELRR